MSSVDASTAALTRAGVRAVATAMLSELPHVGAGTAAHVGALMPEIAATHTDDLVLASCHSNSSALLDALIRGLPLTTMSPSAEVMQTTRELVGRGLTLPAVMRAYRLGLAYWCERWADAVTRHGTAGASPVAVVSGGTGFLLGWLELVTDRLSEEYRDEVERLAREGSLARLEAVRRALEHPQLDIAATSLRLGYDLSGRHMAIVLHQRGEAAPGTSVLDAAARQLTTAVTDARPLIVRADVLTTWCWIPLDETPPRRVPPPTGQVIAGHGRPARGLDGFRRSHHEALEAIRVAELAYREDSTITRYDNVEIASVCSANSGWCRDFVRGELGPLAADDDATRRLRATLETYFAEHSNFRATGKRLGLHHNTVRYRLAQVERLLGRPPEERRLSLELALHLASRLSPWVVEPVDDGPP